MGREGKEKFPIEEVSFGWNQDVSELFECYNLKSI